MIEGTGCPWSVHMVMAKSPGSPNMTVQMPEARRMEAAKLFGLGMSASRVGRELAWTMHEEEEG